MPKELAQPVSAAPAAPWIDPAVLFATPDRPGQDGSAQLHMPFAAWCVERFRPQLVVQTSPVPGDLYFACCQAVAAHGVGSVCFMMCAGIGEREDGGGFFEALAWNESRYGLFSTLSRTPLSEQASSFADGAVDLLVIDGYQDEASARRAYELWLPKLSPQAVVLIHNTNLRKDGNEVWRFWPELAGRHPNVHFAAGRGLGAVAPGKAPPAEFLRLAGLDGAEREAADLLFHQAGRAVQTVGDQEALTRDRNRLLRELQRLEGEAGATRRDLSQAADRLAALQSEAHRRAQAEDQARAVRAELDAALARLATVEENPRALQEAREQIAELRADLLDRESQLLLDAIRMNELHEQLRTVQGGVADRDRHILELNDIATALRDRLGTVEGGIAERDARIIELTSLVSGLYGRLGDADQRIQTLSADLAERCTLTGRLEATIAGMEHSLRHAAEERVRAQAEFDRLHAEIALREQRIAALYASTSWRFAKPVRALGKLVRLLRGRTH